LFSLYFVGIVIAVSCYVAFCISAKKKIPLTMNKEEVYIGDFRADFFWGEKMRVKSDKSKGNF